MSLRLTSLALLLVALCRFFQGSASSKEIELPKIWEADPETKPEGFYRFFYKLEIRRPNKPEQYKSFLIEEWANLGKSQLRIDIQQQPGDNRRTILYYGDTNEVFYYEPFTCHAVGDLNEALYPELVEIFPKNDGSYLKFGIGALWKHAENLDNWSFRFENERSVESSGSFLPLEYSASSMGTYQIASTNGLRDLLTLFFSSKSNTIDSLCLIWIGSKYTISIVDTPKKLRQPREKIEKAFQLPRGYGCALTQNNNGEQDISPLPMSFISLDPSELRLLRLDLVASRPIVYENNNERGSQSYDSPDRWRSHSSSVRILSGGYQIEGYDRSYVVFEKQEANADVSSVSELLANFATCRRTTMRRTKIVWDMSNLGSDSRSRYFKLDVGERKCLGYGETESPLDVSVDLRIAPASSEFEHDSPPLMLTLGIELLGTLFTADGYRLIARNRKRADTSEFVWEKREQQFKMKNQHGQVIWEGPVSFVRQYEAASSATAAASFDSPQSVEKHIITINFYTRHVDRIVARVKILVAESRALEQSNLLDEINVSDCLLRLGCARTFALGAEFVDEIRGGGEQLLDENLAFELEYYSIDEELYETFVASQPLISLKQQIEMDFIRSLVELSDYRLDIMQITRLEVDIRSGDERDAPSWSAKIRGHLLERPSLLNFLRDPGQRFADCEQQQIRSFLKESAKACAESCDHFNCTMFVYCTISSVCDISLDSSSTQPGSGDSGANGGVKISWDPNCVLYRRHNLAQSIISPHEMIHRMSEAIRGQRELSQLGTGGRQLTDTIELRLDGNSEGVPVVLAPESIHSSLLHAQQLEDLAELDSPTAQLAKIQPLVSMTGLIKTSRGRQEYSVLVRDHKYKKSDDRLSFPLAEANHMSYQECESFCRQNDCASFSHCSLEKVCQISNLKQRGRIKQNIEQEHGCAVLIREWITKFERVSGRPLRPRQTFGSVRVETLDECAFSCMERDSPKCRAFYYCPADDSNSRASCHLKSNHLLADTSGESAESNPLNSVANLSCDLYARSYMNNFDKFYGKSLPPSGSDSLATIHRGLEAESCASECADKLGKCIGFQVCTMGGTKIGQFVCTTFSTKLNANLASKLELNPSCTSFLVSPGSELYQLASKKLAEHIQSAIDSARDAMAKPNLVPPAQEKISTIAIWSLRMLFITIGFALGYGVIYGSRRSVLMRNTRKRISNRLPRF